jgi:hypothetical protein
MPQDNPRSESQRPENTRGESTRAEPARSERSSTANTMNPPFGEMGARSVNVGLRLQQEMFDVLQDIGREWFARATSEAELAFKLPSKLTAAHSVPDALSAYQEWLGEWMNMFGEDSRHFVSDSRKIMDTGVRCFADTAPAAMT